MVWVVVLLTLFGGAGAAVWVSRWSKVRAEKELAIERLVDVERKHLTELEKSWNTLLRGVKFVNRRALEAWRTQYETVLGSVDKVAVKRLRDEVDRLKAVRDSDEILVAEANSRFVELELARVQGFLDTVEKSPLTEQQRSAIVHDEDCHLVVAGAGSGKTSLIVGKVGYLLKHGAVGPSGILVLAFAKKASVELEERIVDRVGVSVSVATFHSLGLSLLGQSSGKKPTLAAHASDDRAYNELIHDLIAQASTDPEIGRAIVDFKVLESVPLPPINSDFDQTPSKEFETLNGQQLKSHGERRIADWLALRGISYIYEDVYEIDTATADRRQYQPDFHIAGTSIYIEYFGVDRDGGTREGIDAVSYRQGIEWKRNCHSLNRTNLIELYFFHLLEGSLEESLELQLRQFGFEIPTEIDPSAIERIPKGNTDGFASLMATFLNLFKSNQWTLEELRVSTEGVSRRNRRRTLLFCQVFERVFELYEGSLRESGQIDFNDMILQATDALESGAARVGYTHIIVDEFQDISRGRARFLTAIRGERARLLCVGDDWQSIFKFAGSDVGLMAEMNANFGYSIRTNLERSFRFHEGIAAVSSLFVERNPAQLRKTVVASPNETSRTPVKIFRSSGRENGTAVKKALLEIADAEQGNHASVLLLARYNFELADLGQVGVFENLDLTKMTVHRSKGLEADYVVLFGLQAGTYGFPNERVDDPVLGLVLAGGEDFQHAEERRLFYVALTRARKRVYLIAPSNHRSCFISELTHERYAGLVELDDKLLALECPSCSGEIVRRDGKNGQFFSCGNYPSCDRTFPACSKCDAFPVVGGSSARSCMVCGAVQRPCGKCGLGVMVLRSGKFGNFWGCSEFRQSGCRNTIQAVVGS